MNILQLLQSNAYPICYVQGHHTRLVVFDGGFEVLAKRISYDAGSSYETQWYYGPDEQEAVEEFIKSEEA